MRKEPMTVLKNLPSGWTCVTGPVTQSQYPDIKFCVVHNERAQIYEGIVELEGTQVRVISTMSWEPRVTFPKDDDEYNAKLIDQMYDHIKEAAVTYDLCYAAEHVDSEYVIKTDGQAVKLLSKSITTKFCALSRSARNTFITLCMRWKNVKFWPFNQLLLIGFGVLLTIVATEHQQIILEVLGVGEAK